MGFGLNGIGRNGFWPKWHWPKWLLAKLDQVALDERVQVPSPTRENRALVRHMSDWSSVFQRAAAVFSFFFFLFFSFSFFRFCFDLFCFIFVLRVQVDISTCHFSERFLFRTVLIPNIFCSERLFFPKGFTPKIRNKTFRNKNHSEK